MNVSALVRLRRCSETTVCRPAQSKSTKATATRRPRDQPMALHMASSLELALAAVVA
jgi:hypothetical protein